MTTIEMTMKKSYGTSKKEKIVQASKDYTALKKVGLLLVLLVFGAFVCGMIMLTAVSSQIAYELDKTNTEIRLLEGEIENLIVDIKQGSSVEAVEEKARLQLGMTFPTSDQIVFIDHKEMKQTDLASVLREDAFN